MCLKNIFAQLDPGKMVHQEPFEHGKVQIGYFDKIFHGVSNWKGKQYGLNFIMKKVCMIILIHIRYNLFTIGEKKLQDQWIDMFSTIYKKCD